MIYSPRICHAERCEPLQTIRSALLEWKVAPVASSIRPIGKLKSFITRWYALSSSTMTVLGWAKIAFIDDPQVHTQYVHSRVLCQHQNVPIKNHLRISFEVAWLRKSACIFVTTPAQRDRVVLWVALFVLLTQPLSLNLASRWTRIVVNCAWSRNLDYWMQVSKCLDKK